MGKGKNGKSQENGATAAAIINAWDGKKSTFPEFRKDITKWAVQNKISWILNAGRALFNRMQSLQEEFKKKKQFKILFSAHADDIWTDALESHDNG